MSTDVSASGGGPVRGRVGRTLAALWDAQWPLIGAVGVLTLVLGFIGFRRYGEATGGSTGFWDVLYLDIQLFPLQSGAVPSPIPWELEAARFLAPVTAGFAVAAALAGLFSSQLRLARNRRGGHVVVCGLGRKGLLLTQALRERGQRVVVVERDAGNDLLETCRATGAAVLLGDARHDALLRDAGVVSAARLVAVCGDDGVNAEVAVRARELVRGRRRTPLACIAHVVDPDLCDLLEARELRDSQEASFTLDFFNVFATGARAMLNRYPPAPSAGGAAPHVLVVGLGRLGATLVVQVARDWWAEHAGSGALPRLTVVDPSASAAAHALALRYPQLTEGCTLEPVDVAPDAPEFEHGEFLFDGQGRCGLTAAYVCLDEDGVALSAALALHARLEGLGVRTVVRTGRAVGLASLLGAREETVGADLVAFPLLDWTCDPDLLFGGIYEVIARAGHEDSIHAARARGETPATSPSMVPWEELPERYRRSSLAQARHIGVKLRAVGLGVGPLTDWDAARFTFAPEEVEQLAELEHERFVAERIGDGWTSASGPSDPDRRTSPWLIRWHELPEDVKEIDRRAVRRIPTVLARAGFQVVGRVRAGAGAPPEPRVGASP